MRNALAKKGQKTKPDHAGSQSRFQAAKIDALFPVLDAIAWMDAPSVGAIAQFAGIDPRTAGKLIKNSSELGLIENTNGGFALLLPYPYKGSPSQKESVVRQAVVRHPLLVSVRQFLQLGEDIDSALRKAATVAGIAPFNPSDLQPLMRWAEQLNALTPSLVPEDLVEESAEGKEERHRLDKTSRIAFLSHSSSDKPFVRQLASDLTANGIGVWLDEQRIRVGESIPEKVSQGLAESDYFLIAISAKSVGSEWVKKELNGALMREVQKRKVHVLPLKLDESSIPAGLIDKRYADFSKSYKDGLQDLLASLKADVDG